MEIRKAYKVRIYPNKVQEQKLLQTIDACRFVYNYYLNFQVNAYLQIGKNVPYAALSRDLTRLRNSGDFPWLKEVQAAPIQQSLRILDRAYNNFFRKNALLPKFKSRKDLRRSFRKPKDWHLERSKIQVQNDIVVKHRGRMPRPEATIGTLTISVTKTGKWFASISVIETVNVPEKLEGSIGIDLGLTHTAITSDGQKFGNLTLAKKRAKRLKYLQQSLSRKQKGSHRREKAKLEITHLHEKIANQRMNHLHQVSSAITGKNHALIAVEDLAVANMIKNHKLARSISDVSWYELLRQLQYKQEWRGGQFVKVNRFFPSSKTCSNCLFVMQDMPLSVRKWDCPKCETHHDRDVNAAKNILKQAEAQFVAESTESRASNSLMVTGSLKREYAHA